MPFGRAVRPALSGLAGRPTLSFFATALHLFRLLLQLLGLFAETAGFFSKVLRHFSLHTLVHLLEVATEAIRGPVAELVVQDPAPQRSSKTIGLPPHL